MAATLHIESGHTGASAGTQRSIDQAAQLLHVSRRTIYNRIRDGRLVTIRTIGGSQRVLRRFAQRARRLASGAPHPNRSRRSRFGRSRATEHRFVCGGNAMTTVSRHLASRVAASDARRALFVSGPGARDSHERGRAVATPRAGVAGPRAEAAGGRHRCHERHRRRIARADRADRGASRAADCEAARDRRGARGAGRDAGRGGQRQRRRSAVEQSPRRSAHGRDEPDHRRGPGAERAAGRRASGRSPARASAWR